MRLLLPLLALASGALLAPAVPAQPKRERHTHAWVMELREQLWREVRGRDPELLEAIAADVVADGGGNPALQLLRALARARGVEPDPAFVFRGSLQCLATPEVADTERFPAVHLTMYLPYVVPPPGELRFVLRAIDAAGEVVWRGAIAHGTELRDLRRFHARVDVPVAERPDGTYRVEVETWLDGEAPRPTDPITRATFHVMRGFPERVAELGRRLEALEPSVDAEQRRLAQGAFAPVYGFWQGEPAEGASRAPRDLARAEAMLANLEAGRPALAGMRGWVSVGIGTGPSESALLAVRLDAAPATSDDAGAPQATRRPLVLFVPGGPAWDHELGRPTSPDAVSPFWLRDVLEAASWDAEGRFWVAVLESPGRVTSAPHAVATAVVRLRTLLGAGPETVLVGEREGALAVLAALAGDPALAGRAALVCGGAVDPRQAARLGDLALFAAPAHGHPANVNLARTTALLAQAGARVHIHPADRTPWPIALPLVLPDLATWLRGP